MSVSFLDFHWLWLMLSLSVCFHFPKHSAAEQHMLLAKQPSCSMQHHGEPWCNGPKVRFFACGAHCPIIVVYLQWTKKRRVRQNNFSCSASLFAAVVQVDQSQLLLWFRDWLKLAPVHAVHGQLEHEVSGKVLQLEGCLIFVNLCQKPKT